MTWIKRFDQNPTYPGAARLCDIEPAIRYLSVDLDHGRVHQHVFTTTWREEPDIAKLNKKSRYLSACTTEGITIDLCLHGVHQLYNGNWVTARFIVRAVYDEDLADLLAWLEKMKYIAVAKSLREQFPRIAPTLDKDFWDRLEKETGIRVR